MLSSGSDILHVPRLARALQQHGDAFLLRVFSERERDYCRGRVPELAARFAAKEAASKMLGVGMRIMSEHGIHWHEAEVINNARGKPLLHLHGRAATLAHELGLREWSLSLTHEREYALAFVIGM